MTVYSQKIEENLQANENKRIQVSCWTADHYIKNQQHCYTPATNK